ncbi:MAG: hypothetical protein WDA21_05735 [Bacilli bacterium]
MNYLYSNAIVINNDYALLYYIGLKRLLNLNNEIIFTFKTLIEILKILFKINISINTKRKNDFIDYLYTLEQLSLVSVNNNIKNNSINDLIYLTFNSEKEKKYGYSIISDSEINKILSYSGSVDNIKLLNLYCNIVSRIYTPSKHDNRPFCMQYKYCMPSYKTFKNDGIVQNRSIIKDYINILQDDLNLIKYKNSGYMTKDNKRIKGCNHYILTRDYPNENYDLLFANILEGYKKAKRSEGWNITCNSDRN